jgi:hypothetical protein
MLVSLDVLIVLVLCGVLYCRYEERMAERRVESWYRGLGVLVYPSFESCVVVQVGIHFAIAKSLILSQVTFHGTLLDPDPGQLAVMNELLENFVTHNIVVAKDRIYAPVGQGGLGMIKLEPFLVAQKCAWVRRCYQKINDPWRWEFLRICGFSLKSVRVEFFDKRTNPVLWTIANAFSKFQEQYWKK